MSDEVEVRNNAFASIIKLAEKLTSDGVPLWIIIGCLFAAAMRIARSIGGIPKAVEFLLGALHEARSEMMAAQASVAGSDRPVDLAAKVVDEFSAMLITNRLATADEVSAALLDCGMALQREQGGSSAVIAMLQRAQHAEAITEPPAGTA